MANMEFQETKTLSCSSFSYPYGYYCPYYCLIAASAATTTTAATAAATTPPPPWAAAAAQRELRSQSSNYKPSLPKWLRGCLREEFLVSTSNLTGPTPPNSQTSCQERPVSPRIRFFCTPHPEAYIAPRLLKDRATWEWRVSQDGGPSKKEYCKGTKSTYVPIRIWLWIRRMFRSGAVRQLWMPFGIWQASLRSRFYDLQGKQNGEPLYREMPITGHPLFLRASKPQTAARSKAYPKSW